LHRIGDYGPLADATRAAHPARARELLVAPPFPFIAEPGLVREDAVPDAPTDNASFCPCYGAPMLSIERFAGSDAPWPRDR
jgi:hypothetical protein